MRNGIVYLLTFVGTVLMTVIPCFSADCDVSLGYFDDSELPLEHRDSTTRVLFDDDTDSTILTCIRDIEQKKRTEPVREIADIKSSTEERFSKVMAHMRNVDASAQYAHKKAIDKALGHLGKAEFNLVIGRTGLLWTNTPTPLLASGNDLTSSMIALVANSPQPVNTASKIPMKFLGHFGYVDLPTVWKAAYDPSISSIAEDARVPVEPYRSLLTIVKELRTDPSKLMIEMQTQFKKIPSLGKTDLSPIAKQRERIVRSIAKVSGRHKLSFVIDRSQVWRGSKLVSECGLDITSEVLQDLCTDSHNTDVSHQQ